MWRKKRDNSKVGSGFGKNISNWLDRDMAYPTNVLHLASECNNKNHSATFPEGLSIFINQRVYGGRKSGITGIDLEFDKDDVRYIVTIKSGPNWGNSSQVAKMKAPDKGDYFKYCGQEFWKFISGNGNLYTDIIEPLGYNAKEKNDVFGESYAKMINKFTKEFAIDFCDDSGQINWKKLVEFNSGMRKQ